METDKKGLKKIKAPLTDEEVRALKAGDSVLVSGIIYTGRDAAHKRLMELIGRGEELPVDLQGQIIYYVGPAPAKPGYAAGSAGPTTSYRMDPYTVPLLERGLKGMLGKGERSKEVIEGMKNTVPYISGRWGAPPPLSPGASKKWRWWPTKI
nr:fumarate hydratase C-terminal domain-containing protein [Biomaibacter acetigenes]